MKNMGIAILIGLSIVVIISGCITESPIPTYPDGTQWTTDGIGVYVKPFDNIPTAVRAIINITAFNNGTNDVTLSGDNFQASNTIPFTESSMMLSHYNFDPVVVPAGSSKTFQIAFGGHVSTLIFTHNGQELKFTM